MKFEWDGDKSRSDLEKHGIDFVTAKTLWLDDNRVEIWAPYPLEDRRIITAKYQGKLWTAIYTVRDDAIRIISVRRARKKEIKLYEEEKNGKK
jgi:hypothetical protein